MLVFNDIMQEKNIRYTHASQLILHQSRMDEENEALARQIEASLSFGGPHKHCFTCYSFTRCTRDHDKEQSCDFAKCPNSCGAVFHGCKLEEHFELCPNVEVPCTNHSYGCSVMLSRHDIGAHLAKCPASVVVCMAEWNRWPVYTSQRRKHIPFKQSNPYGQEGQLDFDLTLRDQRMLKNLKNIPRKTRLCLRNSLTKRYPAVPLPKTVIREHRDDIDDNEPLVEEDFLDIGDQDPFVGARQCNDKHSQQQMKQWEEDLNQRLKGKKIPPKYWEFPEMEKGNIHKHCAYCLDLKCKRKFEFVDNSELLDGLNSNEACAVISCKWECGVSYHSCKASEHSLICPKYEEPDEYEWMTRGMNNVRREDKKNKNDASQPKLKENLDFFQGPGEPAFTPVKDSKGIPKPPALNRHYDGQVYLDVRLETVTRLQSKPGMMYTFVCAQEFRRDEFAWHSRTIHNDVMGGMNNWIEHRCPLSCYGCGFSHRRLFPFRKEQTLIFSPAVESFGITQKLERKEVISKKSQMPYQKTGKVAAKKAKSLADLPYEVLCIVFQYVDSFR